MAERKYNFLSLAAAAGLLGTAIISSACGRPSQVEAQSVVTPSPEFTKPPTLTLLPIRMAGPATTPDIRGGTPTPVTKGAIGMMTPGTATAAAERMKPYTATPFQKNN
jgi:hypothetical protein